MKSCLPLPNQASQRYHLSGKEIEVCSLTGQIPILTFQFHPVALALTLLLNQSCMAPPHGGLVGILLHPFKLCGQDPFMATTSCCCDPF